MTTLSFDDVSVSDALPVDDAPETTDDAHYCKAPGCTNEVFRNGTRGRWPSYCAEHKKTSSGAKTTSAKATPAAAKQAAQVLGGINDMLATAAFAVGLIPGITLDLSNTAAAIAAKNEPFMAQAEVALSQDPALCRAINRAGGTSGKLALAMAYAMFGASLVPAVQADLKASKGETEK